MQAMEFSDIYCPYCNEPIQVSVDCSEASQSYIEDCQVCCQPILLNINIDPQNIINIEARQENE